MAKLIKNRHLALTATAWAATVLIANSSSAQSLPNGQPGADVTLAPVLVKPTRTDFISPELLGLGDTPLERTPVSASLIDATQMRDSGARRLADLVKFEPALTDAYNAVGYWDYASVRGFVLDNRFNYRRDGLPISAETAIALDNKERVELLKGSSGIQAGTSAPGGLINYVVKRPTRQDLRSVRLEVGSGGALAAIDLGGRFGTDKEFGYRFNAAAENLPNTVPHSDGSRQLLALATDWRINADALLQAEFEYARRSQPSVPGLSLTGSSLPAVDPRLNINSQPWSLPVLLEGLTGSLRFEQALGAQWRWSLHAASQHLKSDDRAAFPFGCSEADTYLADRYCSDGRFDLYDYRSENERRHNQALRLQLSGSVETGAIAHELTFAVLQQRTKDRFDGQAYNWVGTSSLAQLVSFAPDPSLTLTNTNRTERSTELSATDTLRLNPQWSVWLGLRHSRIRRQSVRTDGSAATDISQGLTTPWLALGYQLNPTTLLYASAGQGAESQVVPSRPDQYSNAGELLPLLKSRQTEIGLKVTEADWRWQLAAFDIRRPVSNLDACNRLGINPCLGQYDGRARHQGVEASGQWQGGPWRLAAGLTWLHARREGSLIEPANNGQQPTNVPPRVLRAQAEYRVAAIAGLTLQTQLSHESRRQILPDATLSLPGWSQIDAAVHYDTRLQQSHARWSLAVDNLLDRRFFRESPYQFGHVYLFSAKPRTWRVTLQVDL